MLPCAAPPRCRARERQHPAANSEGHRASPAARPAGRRRWASNPGARAAFKFLASLAARTRIGTRPHIQRRERRPRPPCLGVEKRRHPTELSTPGERSAGRTQHASHRILSQRRTGTPPLGAELRRDKRFCGEPGGGEPHATSHTHRATRTRLTQPLPLIVFSAARCGACIQMAKNISPDSRLPRGLPTPARTPDSRADSRLPRGLPTPPGLPTPAATPDSPRTPDSRADSRLPPRPRPSTPDSRLAPGLPTPAPTPASPLTLDSRPDSRLAPGLPTPAPTPGSPRTLDSRPDSRLAPDPRLPPRLPARPRPSTPAPDSRLPARPGPSTRDSRLAPDPRLPPRLPTRPRTPGCRPGPSTPAPGLPTRPGTPDSRLAPDPRLPPRLPTRPGPSTPAPTPGSPQTLDSRPDSRLGPGLPAAAPDPRLPTRPGTPDSRLAPDPRLPPRLPTRPGTPDLGFRVNSRRSSSSFHRSLRPRFSSCPHTKRQRKVPFQLPRPLLAQFQIQRRPRAGLEGPWRVWSPGANPIRTMIGIGLDETCMCKVQ